jgi:hypothetical protein
MLTHVRTKLPGAPTNRDQCYDFVNIESKKSAVFFAQNTPIHAKKVAITLKPPM